MNTKSFVRLMVKRPRVVLLVFTIFTILVGSQISNLYMESDFSTYLPQNDSRLEIWEKINNEFNLGSTIIVIVDQTEKTHDVRSVEVLKEMDDIAKAANKFPSDNGEDGVISVQSLAELIKKENSKSSKLGYELGGTGYNEIPTEDELNDYKFLSRPSVESMKGFLFTDDYKYAVIIIQVANDADFDSILVKTENAVKNRGTTYASMKITGTVAMQKAIQENSMTNLVWMFPIALILVSVVIFFFHRNLKSILIAFLPPAYALVLTFGVLGFVQPQLSIISVAIVALLMGLGVDYSIHLMNRLAEEKTMEDVVERVDKTMKSTGKAILLSTVTTMIGFGSLMISSMSPMVTFGFGCAIGILFCFISAMILVPCLVLILKFQEKAKLPSWKLLADFAIKNRVRIIAVASFFVVMSLLLIPIVETDVNYSDMSPEGIPEVEAMELYSEEFGGGVNFNALLIETDSDGLKDIETISEIYNMSDKMIKEVEELGYTITVTSIADAINKLEETLSRVKVIEQLIDLIANLSDLRDQAGLENLEGFLFDKIAQANLVDDHYSKTIVLVSIPAGKSVGELEEIVNKVNQIASETKLPHNGQVSELTGQDAITVAVNKKLGDEQTRSMVLALLFVLAALIIIFNSTAYGVLTIIPVGFVLAWEPGFLVALDVSLSVVTISIASIMIGIGIDYGIHISQRVKEGLEQGLSKKEATKDAIEKTGLSLVEAACTTIAGLVSIYFVNIPSLHEFGIIVILMTALSLIAAVLILPVFLLSKMVK